MNLISKGPLAFVCLLPCVSFAGSVSPAEPVEQEETLIATAELVSALELKQAYMAKAASMSYIDASRSCVGLAMQKMQPLVDMTGSLKKARVVDPRTITLLFEAGERAAKIAGMLDVLGDKALLRQTEVVQEAKE